jgi:hypothetical protein
VALGARNGRKKVLGLPLPKLGGGDSAAKALASAGKEAAKLADEVRKTREQLK